MADRAKMAEIRAIEDRYGVAMFGMSLTHLIDTGVQNFTDENVASWLKQIEEQGKENDKNGVTSVLTPSFQIALINCAAEIAKFSIWEIVTYISNYIKIKVK